MQNSKLKIPFTPWITKGILTSAGQKNRLYKKFMKSHHPIHEAQYKTYKNKLNHIIRLAKHSYFDKKFLNAKNDLKETWKLIYEVINNRKRKPSLPSSFILHPDSRVITDPLEIANSFCSYFTNIGQNLASKIPLTNLSFQSFLAGNENEPISLKLANITELDNICRSFKAGKNSGYDNIPMYVIKNSFNLISKPLLHVINLSLTKGIFPDKLKIAKLIPIFKTDDPQCFNNYTPISLLPNFSNFFEKNHA